MFTFISILSRKAHHKHELLVSRDKQDQVVDSVAYVVIREPRNRDMTFQFWLRRASAENLRDALTEALEND